MAGYGLSDLHAPFLVETLKDAPPLKTLEVGNNNFKVSEGEGRVNEAHHAATQDKGVEIVLAELIN